MLLKSLELQGYKTFANRTLFEFAGTVTAIVGPNGSGKSNIADSVRWVLGEQSYSLLRGKKTADMIFSGSENRPRAGMASASIVFDNSSGWLPIDFTDVAITRRAYRDGQNEYLINGQRVRLRDVSELLSQSGLAERTYTIIGQGVVDAALTLKAEDRRRLFEEAAGIGLHRSRREESLRRLETTRRNLERVQDIMVELQPRLRSLERQAHRAKEHEQLRADLRASLREWYGYNWHRAQHELTAVRDIAQNQEAALEGARLEQKALDDNMMASRQRIHSLRSRLGSWHRQLSQLHIQREEINRQRAVSKERTRSLNDQTQALRIDLANLQEELGLQQERLDTANQDVQRWQAELAEARSQAETARQELNTRQEKRAQAEEAVSNSQESISSLRGKQGELQVRQTERQAFITRLKGDSETTARAVLQAEKDLLAAQSLVETKSEARRLAEATRQQADEAIRSLSHRLVEVENTRKSTFESRAAQVVELTRLRAEIDVLEGAEQALSGYANGAQVLLKAAREDRLKGSRGALSNHLEVSSELEAAIAAALGEYLDAVVLDKGGFSDIALDLLNAQSARGVLIPLDALRPTPAISSIQDEGILGVASDLISTSPELRPALELLLGRTLVVRNRQTANRVLSAGNLNLSGLGAEDQNHLRAVTLQGEVFHASGPVLAGQKTKSTTLSRPRRRNELSKSSNEVENHISRLDEELKGLDQELEVLRNEGETLEQELVSARQAESDAAEEDNLATITIEQAERELRWQVAAQERVQTEIHLGAQEINEISFELEEIDKEIIHAQDDFLEKRQVLTALDLEEFQAQVAHWNTITAVTSQRLNDARGRLEEREIMLARAENALNDTQARLAEMDGALEILERQEKDSRESQEELNKQIDDLRVSIDPAEIELTTLEGEQETLLQAEAEARQSLSMAEHNFAQARINLARKQEALDTWRRRIEDDFGLVDFSYDDEISGPTPLPIDGMVEQLPRVDKLSPQVKENVKRKRSLLRRMGAINPEAQNEYQEVKARYEFLADQVADLEKAESDVRQVITELDTLMEQEFCKTYEAVTEEFSGIFKRMFGGGSAHLALTDPNDITNTGIDIEARLPGRRAQGLSLLSGGERSLTATALIFALLKISPTPFCLLDEVDAMLDETNIGRFRDLLRELSQNTQFIIVTHNRNTVQVADVIYGVTMGRDSASQIISLKMDEVSQVVK